MTLAMLKSQTVVGAEAQYNVARLQYEDGNYDKAIASAFEVINNMSSQCAGKHHVMTHRTTFHLCHIRRRQLQRQRRC